MNNHPVTTSREPEYLRFPGSRDRVIIHRLRTDGTVNLTVPQLWISFLKK